MKKSASHVVFCREYFSWFSDTLAGGIPIEIHADQSLLMRIVCK
ncbi:hypothetical protein [Kushneria konosiri]|nr:hypothetical protein [Kushneria konosiri]